MNFSEVRTYEYKGVRLSNLAQLLILFVVLRLLIFAVVVRLFSHLVSPLYVSGMPLLVAALALLFVTAGVTFFRKDMYRECWVAGGVIISCYIIMLAIDALVPWGASSQPGWHTTIFPVTF